MIGRPASARWRGTGSWLLLAAVGGLFGLASGLPYAEGALVSVAGIIIGGILRRPASPAHLRPFALLPVVIGVGAVAIASPFALLTELLAGLSALAILVWLADDPARPAGGVARARYTIGIPGAALGIAWASALLLPSNSASLGVAAALLVFVIAAVAFLVGQPSTFDREEPSA